jgi:hypothetical protein
MTTPPTTVRLEVREGKCADGVTQAAIVDVQGPNGSFTWCGGQPALESLMDFLTNLRISDHQVAKRITLHRFQ